MEPCRSCFDRWGNSHDTTGHSWRLVTHREWIREHVEVIFETFHDGSDYEERLNGVLDYYDECTPRLDLAHTDREEPPTAEPQSED
ncbi:MAG: hypothetical protein ACOCSN_05450 [Halanaeroarchaeum sp.]